MFIQERNEKKYLVIRKIDDVLQIRAWGFVPFGGLGDIEDDEEEAELDALPINMIKYEIKEASGADLVGYIEGRIAGLSFADQVALNTKLGSARHTLNMAEYNPFTKEKFIEVTTYLQGSSILTKEEKGLIKDIILDYAKENKFAKENKAAK